MELAQIEGLWSIPRQPTSQPPSRQPMLPPSATDIPSASPEAPILNRHHNSPWPLPQKHWWNPNQGHAADRPAPEIVGWPRSTSNRMTQILTLVAAAIPDVNRPSKPSFWSSKKSSPNSLDPTWAYLVIAIAITRYSRENKRRGKLKRLEGDSLSFPSSIVNQSREFLKRL